MEKNQSKALIDIKIEDELFQSLIAFLIKKVKGVCLPPLGLLDIFFAKSGMEKIRFIGIKRDDSLMNIAVTITAKVEMGIEIPSKAKEIQKLVRAEVEKSTGYSVTSVYIIFSAIEEKKKKGKVSNQLQLDAYLDH